MALTPEDKKKERLKWDAPEMVKPDNRVMEPTLQNVAEATTGDQPQQEMGIDRDDAIERFLRDFFTHPTEKNQPANGEYLNSINMLVDRAETIDRIWIRPDRTVAMIPTAGKFPDNIRVAVVSRALEFARTPAVMAGALMICKLAGQDAPKRVTSMVAITALCAAMQVIASDFIVRDHSRKLQEAVVESKSEEQEPAKA